MRIAGNERILIVGPTGSGKSTLANAIASRWERYLIFDPKADPAAVLPNSAVVRGSRAAWRALPGRVVYRPDLADHEDLPGAFDPLVGRIWSRGGHVGILLHETADVAPSSGSRRWLSMAIRQGREPRRIPIIACTQRPRWIDLLLLSEAEHVYLMGLRSDEDRKAVSSVMGVPWRQLSDPEQRLGTRHGFYYRGPDGKVSLHRPLHLE